MIVDNCVESKQDAGIAAGVSNLGNSYFCMSIRIWFDEKIESDVGAVHSALV